MLPESQVRVETNHLPHAIDNPPTGTNDTRVPAIDTLMNDVEMSLLQHLYLLYDCHTTNKSFN